MARSQDGDRRRTDRRPGRGALLARGSAPSDAATPTGTSVIVLIGDGMGPAQRAATQLARYGLETPQPMDALPVSGSMMTQSTNAITDSAAGATAIATGVKTNNGYIGVGPDGERLPTLLEIARDAGKSTGLVEDTDVTNATTGSVRGPRQGPRPAPPDRQELPLRHEARRDPRRRRAVLVPAR